MYIVHILNLKINVSILKIVIWIWLFFLNYEIMTWIKKTLFESEYCYSNSEIFYSNLKIDISILKIVILTWWLAFSPPTRDMSSNPIVWSQRKNVEAKGWGKGWQSQIAKTKAF
jgi:hypothetical protein